MDASTFRILSLYLYLVVMLISIVVVKHVRKFYYHNFTVSDLFEISIYIYLYANLNPSSFLVARENSPSFYNSNCNSLYP